MTKNTGRSRTADRPKKSHDKKVLQTSEPKMNSTTKTPGKPSVPITSSKPKQKSTIGDLGKSEDTVKPIVEPKRSHIPSRGEHHCPHKGAKPHTLSVRLCLKKKHVGYCGICGILTCYRAGCMHHRSVGTKNENLFGEDSVELRDIVAKNKALGVFGPNCMVSYKFEAGRVILFDKPCGEQTNEVDAEDMSEDLFEGMEDADDGSRLDTPLFED